MNSHYQLNYSNNINIIKITLDRANFEYAESFGIFIEEVKLGQNKDVLLDFNLCQYVDSTFLGKMVRNYIRLKKNGYNVKIVCNKKVAFLLCDVSKLSSVIEVFTDTTEALKSFDLT